jgi:hypothetical protein
MFRSFRNLQRFKFDPEIPGDQGPAALSGLRGFYR